MTANRRGTESAQPLPSRDGVGASCVALPEGPWHDLLDFLCERFVQIPRDEWQDRMARGEVVDAQGRPLPADAPFIAHRKVHYYRRLPTEPRLPVEEAVLYQDEWIVVADKPHFLPVLPSGRYLQETLLVRLKRRLGLDTLAPVHRIDRETAGLVLFTVRPETRGRYQALFRERAVDKRYEAVAGWRDELAERWHGVMRRRSRLVDGDSFMTVREADGEPNAETEIELLAREGDWARYGLRPLSGKRHQLRVHMAALGLPLRHDLIYPVLQPDSAQPDWDRPLQLLARSLSFTDPVTREARNFESRFRLQWPVTPGPASGGTG